MQAGDGENWLAPGGGHGCRLKEGGGGFGKWTPVTGPMYGARWACLPPHPCLPPPVRHPMPSALCPAPVCSVPCTGHLLQPSASCCIRCKVQQGAQRTHLPMPPQSLCPTQAGGQRRGILRHQQSTMPPLHDHWQPKVRIAMHAASVTCGEPVNQKLGLPQAPFTRHRTCIVCTLTLPTVPLSHWLGRPTPLPAPTTHVRTRLSRTSTELWRTNSCRRLYTNRPGGGGGNAVAGIGKRCGKMRKKCAKCGKKCDRKCGFVRMVYAPRNPCVSSRLARSGAQSMDGLMEQLSAVVQLKNITD